GHSLGRLAHRAHAGLRDLQGQAPARAGFAAEQRRGDLHGVDARRAGVHHARGRDLDHGHRLCRAAQGGALEQVGLTWAITIPAGALTAMLFYSVAQLLAQVLRPWFS
ncbi:MAG TPA: hypothetical protein PKD73_17565, partial [Burkholderiaceae bacterium]|nr:hypothetical protein [Burkholderiaceae bacterium]